MTYDEIVNRFKVKSHTSKGVMCFCPCHNDKQASLGISHGRKGTILHCFAGCDNRDILSAVGLSMKDLFDV